MSKSDERTSAIGEGRVSVGPLEDSSEQDLVGLENNVSDFDFEDAPHTREDMVMPGTSGSGGGGQNSSGAANSTSNDSEEDSSKDGNNGVGAKTAQASNSQPTDISVSGNTIAENASEGTIVAKLSAVDPDSGDTFTYAIPGGSPVFEIVGNEIRVKAGADIDFERAESHEIKVEVTDSAGNTYSEAVTVAVEDVNEGPTDITLKGGSVAENAADGTVVARLGAVDPDSGETFTYSIPGGSSDFEIVGNEIRVKAGANIDFESAKSHEITVQVKDSGGNTYSEKVSISVDNVNEGPTDITLKGGSVAENAADGTVVAKLGAVDPDSGETFTYSIPGGSSDFEIVGNEIRVKAGANIDFESAKSHEITVQVKDSGGNTYSEKVSISVDNVNEGPTDITLKGGSVAENAADGTVVAKLGAVDPDSGETFTYSIPGGSSDFEIVGNEIRVKAGADIDFESAKSHEITVQVKDSGGNTYSEKVSISVDNVNEGPTDITLKGGSVAENAADGTVVAKLGAVDPDSGETFTYSIPGGSSDFEIVGNEIRVKAGANIDFESAKSHEITVQVKDSGGNTYSEKVSISVDNVNEGPTDITLKGGSVAENAADGTVVARLGAVDPDSGETFTYSIPGGSSDFEIVGNEIRVKAGADIDFESAKSHEITVQVKDSGGNTYSEKVTLSVTDVAESNLMTGTKNADYMRGTAQDDTIKGLAGNDTLIGGTGNDKIEGGDGNDRLFGQAGADELRGGAGNDIIWADKDDTVVDGGDGYDRVIVQGDGDFKMDLAKSNVERVDSGKGNDTLDASGSTVNTVILGNDGDDTIKGGSGRDNLQGGTGNDKIDGGAGNDYIFGQAGADELRGGDGNDTMWADKDDTVVDGGDGYDRVIVQGDGDFKMDLAKSNVERVDSGKGNDTLDASGSTVNTVILGNDGDDTIKGGSGRDNLQGGTGNDKIDGGAGNDYIFGQAGADELRGGDGNDTMWADKDDTVVDGGDGYDRVIVQGDGDFKMDLAKSNVERVDSGKGNDTLDASGSTSNTVILGNDGDDTIAGGSGRDNLQGGTGNDKIDGGAGNDYIFGQAGADELRGGDGNDTMWADKDDTVVEGGDGYDRVIVQGDGDFSLDMTKGSVERVDSGKGDDTLDASGSKTATVILGNDGDDTITGGDANDNLQGGTGDDTIKGGAGNDYMLGGTGNDKIDGGDGNDRLIGQAGADELRGGAGNDLLYADADDTVVEGGDGYDRVIVQSDGDFSLDMTKGSVERVDSGKGDDTLDASGSKTATVILGNDGDDTITGGDANDNLQGGTGDDTIKGGAGNDYMLGGTGNDKIDGGDGNDRLIGQAGADELRGGAGNDLLYADADDTVVEGGDGYDRVIVQGDGDFSLDMTKGSVERVDSGKGDDTLDASGSKTATVILGNDGDDTITGGDANDNLQGGTGDDTIKGGAGNDYMLGGTGNDKIDGGDGNDRLLGQAGADELRGGAGNDLLYADAEDTVVEGGDGYDRVIVQGDGDFRLDMTKSDVERVDSGKGNDTLDASGSKTATVILGNDGDDTITGGDANDNLQGGTGNDTVKGGAGNDYVYGQDGNDDLSGGAGNDYMLGGTGNDKIDGGNGNDRLIGQSGADELRGGTGNDLLYADADDTVVEGGDGYDRVIVQGEGDFKLDMTKAGVERVDSGKGDDTLDASGSKTATVILGNDGNDTITGGDANDNLQGGTGDDTVNGGDGNDYVYGQDGNDNLSGGAGNDYMLGGTGNDKIEGGAGNDRMYGQDGNDLFVFGEGGGSDYAYGGSGSAWTDTVELEGGADLGTFGTDWTVKVTSGSITAQDANSLSLSDDADGVIVLQDGSELQFRDIEVIQW